MKIPTLRSWPLSALLLTLACNKPPAETTPPGGSETAPTGTELETEVALTNACSDNYSVKGAVSAGELSESINGQDFTDGAPFECELTTSAQQVQFDFNDSSTDSSTSCKYALTYTNNDGGAAFSGSQTLDCSNAALGFTVTATPDSGSSSCRGLPVLVEDPEIQLKTKNCGNDVD